MCFVLPVAVAVPWDGIPMLRLASMGILDSSATAACVSLAFCVPCSVLEGTRCP